MAMQGCDFSSGKELDLLPVFPYVFTLSCIITFVPPAVKCFRVVFDPSVAYWLGSAGQYLVFLPFLPLGVAHIIHRARKAPNKVAVICGLVVTSVIFLVLGDHFLMRSLDYGNKFASTDCETFPAKRELQRRWQEAQEFHASCTVSGDAPPGGWMIDECQGYDEALAVHPEWPYLELLEERYACGGWCRPSAPLWTLRDSQDSCSDVVAEIMLAKVNHAASQVVVYTIALIATSSVAMIAIGPSLRACGFDW